MGTVAHLADVRLTGTADLARLKLIARVLSIRSDRNTPAQSAKLAAAVRLIGVKG